VTGDALRARLREAFVAAVASVDLGVRVRESLASARLGRGGVAVVAIGKAAPAMAKGALEALGPRVTQALVVAPDGTPASLDDARVTLLRASHPDPDARSVGAARRALQVAGEADALVALISGGASSLVCLPEGLTLRCYVSLVRALRLAGADVREMNVARRHLCAVKGGGLARVVRGPVLTRVASDVVGGGVHDVGSGPTVVDPTTIADARRVLRKYLPRRVLPALHETIGPGDAGARRWRSRVLASPDELAREVAARLRGSFAVVRVLQPSVEPVAALALEYAARGARLRPGEALVRAAEPSLRVTGTRPGRGGRSTHLACAVAGALPEGVALLAGASDGDDGSSGTGGAVVDANLGDRVPARALEDALRGFDTGRLVLRAGMAIDWGPTGTNLADVHVLARAAG
jgi:hydroxypyruvate reductase